MNNPIDLMIHNLEMQLTFTKELKRSNQRILDQQISKIKKEIEDLKNKKTEDEAVKK